MNTRKVLLAVLGVAIIVLSVYLANVIVNSKTSPKPRARKVVKTVFVDTVQNGNVPIVVPANGKLVARQRVDLFSEVQGVFQGGAKLFRPGQAYRKGQVLLRINAEEYRASVQSAKSNLYNQITSIMPDLRLDYPEVAPKWEAYLRAFDMQDNVPPLPEMDSDKERFFVNGRGIITSYYNVKNMETRLGKYVLRAPFNGILTEALVTEGSLVRAGQQLGEFIDPSAYELEVAVPKTYSDLLRTGKSVELSSLEGGKTYTGQVSRINAKVDPASQTVKAFIEVSDPELKEGMYLEAMLRAREEENAIEVDRSLLLDNNEIFVVRDSVLDLMPVQPVYFAKQSVVLKGVPEGTVMVSRPVSGGYAGMPVTVFQDQPEKSL